MKSRYPDTREDLQHSDSVGEDQGSLLAVRRNPQPLQHCKLVSATANGNRMRILTCQSNFVILTSGGSSGVPSKVDEKRRQTDLRLVGSWRRKALFSPLGEPLHGLCKATHVFGIPDHIYQ